MSNFRIFFYVLGNTFGAAFLSVLAAEITRGKNRSDVGVALYESPALAFMAGIGIYFLVLCVGFLMFRKVNAAGRAGIPIWFSLHALAFPATVLVLRWITGF